ncbi:MAG: hypothetical protein A2Z20_05370 [Bdellovibrionales bacterium RBG_16_40_8]|nr:MAG: hypothetical protein A2Z20_05370 [Bdellovibrionales bacterium RBG_16_40_8]
MRYIAALIMLATLVGCATGPAVRGASEYLIVTDKNTARALKDLRAKLEENNYVIKKVDTNSGILVTAPRKFTYKQDGEKISAYQSIQFRQEGSSMKVRIVYKCKYSDEGIATVEPCYQDDQVLAAKAKRIEPKLIAVVQRVLLKSGEYTEPEEQAAEDEKK